MGKDGSLELSTEGPDPVQLPLKHIVGALYKAEENA